MDMFQDQALQRQPCKDSPREPKDRKTMKEVGGQHPRMDRDEPGKIQERGRGQRQMEESGGRVFTGAPTT